MLAHMDTNAAEIPRLGFTMDEAAIASSLSRRSLYRAVARGELRRVKVGRRSLIPADALEALCGQASGEERAA
jgi:excisionase family DNA binding protein